MSNHAQIPSIGPAPQHEEVNPHRELYWAGFRAGQKSAAAEAEQAINELLDAMAPLIEKHSLTGLLATHRSNGLVHGTWSPKSEAKCREVYNRYRGES